MDPNPSRNVRVVAKIRGFTEQEAEISGQMSWISVNKPSEECSRTVVLSFGNASGSRRESCEVDYCYEQNEGNETIFSREVKPLISGVFDGCNATVIAFGARNSGKTSLIQGRGEKTGLAAMTMAEIFSVAAEKGKTISISFYEVYQERVCDLLDDKQPTVFVLEDAQGKVQLKGLSKVPVKSVSEFQKFVDLGSRKPAQKIATELPRRGHKGLVVHVSSCSENPETFHLGKLNFVDLAGYEDVRRQSIDGFNHVERSKINKSIYAFLNVIHALSAKEGHVPYRESKLARTLQDSLGGASKILMVACLNPTLCQDSICMISLASRSCHKVNKVLNSTKKIYSSVRSTINSSKKNQIPKTVSAIEKKQCRPRMPLSEKKVNIGGRSFAFKGRKLFDEARQLTPSEKDNTFSVALKNPEPSPIVEKENSSTESLNHAQDSSIMEEQDVSEPHNDRAEKTSPTTNSTTNTKSLTFHNEGQNTGNESNGVLVNEDKSPPLSARLQALRNNFKSFCSETAVPFYAKTTEGNASSSNAIVSYREPITPVTEQKSMGTENRFTSPFEAFSMCKSSVTEEYLKFLNSANKDELKQLKWIGEKRAAYILELRDESPEPFKSLDDLENIGLSAKQVPSCQSLLKLNSISGLAMANIYVSPACFSARGSLLLLIVLIAPLFSLEVLQPCCPLAEENSQLQLGQPWQQLQVLLSVLRIKKLEQNLIAFSSRIALSRFVTHDRPFFIYDLRFGSSCYLDDVSSLPFTESIIWIGILQAKCGTVFEID
ncbi:hypothetical protein UlMin_024548 [Ulmus minor]